MSVYADVMDERGRQDAKWGEQNHDPMTWIAILAEEVGEAARDALALKFGAAKHGGAYDALGRFRKELVQVAAVATAIVECIDRDKWRGAKATVCNAEFAGGPWCNLPAGHGGAHENR